MRAVPKTDSKNPPGTEGERVYRRLRAEILEGKRLPGTRLRQEEIAGSLKASRTPVREAVARLASEGLANSDARRGAIVAELSMLDFIEINRFRLLLEPYSTRIAAEMIPSSEIDRLEEAVAAAKADGNDAVINVDQEIHRTLARYCRNSRIERMIVELNDCMALARVYDIQGRHDEVIADLERMIAHLRARDGDAAAALMYEHIEAFYSVIDPRAPSERSAIGPSKRTQPQ